MWGKAKLTMRTITTRAFVASRSFVDDDSDDAWLDKNYEENVDDEFLDDNSSVDEVD